MSTYNTKVSPPVAGYPPTNVGGGYGRTTNKFHKPRAVMGGETGIYNPVGKYDKEINQEEYEEFIEEENSEDSFDDYDFNIELNRMIGTTGHKQADDSFAYKGVNPFHYVDSSTALRAGHNIEGDLVFESIIKEYVKEVINEFGRSTGRSGKTSISGKQHIKRSNNMLGSNNPYPKIDATLSPSGKSYNVGHKTTNVKIKRTASGSDYSNAVATDEMLDSVGNFENYDEELSSFQNLKNNLDIETNSLGSVGNKNKSRSRDEFNVYRHNNKKLKHRNI